ncbi:MAG TPA: hypothetical protein VEM76_05050 [Anaeromyxobacteraceae bacterium]|nr:hypothetical protein [Anaeromyxobacteraceae bacterium]
MHRGALVLFALAALITATARAGDAAAPPGFEPTSGAVLPALPPALAPRGRDALGATDASGGSTILVSALYGGLAGAVVGVGVGLLEQGNYGRDLAVGTGAGVLIGGALGAARAFGDARSLAVTDGLNTTERYPVLTARTLRLGGRF